MTITTPGVYPGRLRQLTANLRATVQDCCPEAQMRLTYAPFENLDVLIEVYLPPTPRQAALLVLGEEIGSILAAGYTVRALVRDTRQQPPGLSDIDLLPMGGYC